MMSHTLILVLFLVLFFTLVRSLFSHCKILNVVSGGMIVHLQCYRKVKFFTWWHYYVSLLHNQMAPQLINWLFKTGKLSSIAMKMALISSCISLTTDPKRIGSDTSEINGQDLSRGKLISIHWPSLRLVRKSSLGLILNPRE